MINGVHSLIYTKQPEEMRTFFRDVLGLKFVDAGGGWQIFALPPAEVAMHPDDQDTHVEMYLMCDDIEGTLADLKTKGVEISHPVEDRRWGLSAGIRMPDGSVMGIYEPRHATAIGTK
jgi:predicted enzyme related to lactoylglutathione lyase